MKKTLIAVAALSAMAASAMAADVTLYGTVDYALRFTQSKSVAGVKTKTTQLKSSNKGTSAFGIKGSEDLGNGVKVSFQYEAEVVADTGAVDADRLFGRVATLAVSSDYGTVTVGRFGVLESATGPVAITGGKFSAMSTGWSDSLGDCTVVFKGKYSSRADNAVAYQTPKFAGFQGVAMYSSNLDTIKVGADDKALNKGEFVSTADKYYGVGLTYANGPLAAAISYSSVAYKHGHADNTKNSQTVDAGVSYDFGMVKPMIEVQTWNGGRMLEGNAKVFDKNNVLQTKGTAVTVGATAPVCGGTAYLTIGYGKDKPTNPSSDVKTTRGMAAVGYAYSVSKRTTVYTAAGYDRVKTEKQNAATNTRLLAGVTHTF